MKQNLMNGIMKVVNSVLWAVLIKLLLTVGFEIWIFYKETLPETARPIEFWGNAVVVMVFLIALTTFQFKNGSEVRTEYINNLPSFPAVSDRTQSSEIEQKDIQNKFDELIKKDRKLDRIDDIEKIKKELE